MIVERRVSCPSGWKGPVGRWDRTFHLDGTSKAADVLGLKELPLEVLFELCLGGERPTLSNSEFYVERASD